MFQSSISRPILTVDVSRTDATVHDDGLTVGPAIETEGEVPAFTEFRLPDGPNERLVPITDPASIGAELFRTLSSRLRQAQRRHGIKRLLVTSAIPGEGKTLVSASLSITFALHQKRTLLIDGDLRSSSLSRWFGIVDDSFVATWQEKANDSLPLLRKAEGLPLWVVPAGKPVALPGGILQSAEFADALAGIASEFDWVIIDSPPLIPFGDAATLSSLADAIVLVTRKSVTPKATLAEALKTLDKSKIVATVLNMADVPSNKYYNDYYTKVPRALPTASSWFGPKPKLLDPK